MFKKAFPVREEISQIERCLYVLTEEKINPNYFEQINELSQLLQKIALNESASLRRVLKNEVENIKKILGRMFSRSINDANDLNNSLGTLMSQIRSFSKPTETNINSFFIEIQELLDRYKDKCYEPRVVEWAAGLDRIKNYTYER